MTKEETLNLGILEQPRTPSVTDMVYDELYKRIVDLKLLPSTKISEAEVAGSLGVSRQPVRDAFYRLSQQGFLLIRPQRATTVSPISSRLVMQARFIRIALEIEVIREAVRGITTEDIARLDANLAEQKIAAEAHDRVKFHIHDDQFHQILCELAGHPEVWQLIKDNKAHMDRVRYLSLEDGATYAYDEHMDIMDAIRNRDTDRAVHEMRTHLARIGETLPIIRARHTDYFEQEDET